MGRPRRDSNKSDSSSTAGNVYNASLAAAQQQKGTDAPSYSNNFNNESASDIKSNISFTPNLETSGTGLTPQLGVISLNGSPQVETDNAHGIMDTNSSATNIPNNTNNANNSSPTGTPSIHRRSLSIAELVSLVSPRSSTGNHTNSAVLNSLNLPEALKQTLEQADSPILNALLPLIRQKLAAKTALNRRNSANVESSANNLSSNSLDSQGSRRSSSSSRSEDHRMSHKLAERKRRKEMKDVFDGLKDVLPPGVPKSSKWEILNEASGTIDDLLAQEQALLNQRNQLLKKINESSQK